MIKDHIRYVFRNLQRRLLRNLLTMLGIFIGVAAVVSLISLGSGLEESIIGQFSSIGPDRITIQASGVNFGPPGSGAVKKLTDNELRAVKNVKGISIAASRIIRTTSIEFNNIQTYSLIASIPQDKDSKRLVEETLNMKVEIGRDLRTRDNLVTILGNSFLKDNTFGKKLKVGNKILINGQKVEIIGFYEKVSNPQFNSLITLNEKPLKEILNIDDETDMILAKVSNLEEMDLIKDRLEKKIRKERHVEKGKEDFVIETPKQIIETLTSILGIIQTIIVGIASISLIVGGVGIANTMFTSVLERRKEIGILKAIGASNNTILSLFLIESGFLGIVGGIIGIILGVIFSETIVFIGTIAFGEGLLNASFSPFLLIGVVIFSFCIGIVSGFIPAHQASSIPPVEALRK